MKDAPDPNDLLRERGEEGARAAFSKGDTTSKQDVEAIAERMAAFDGVLNHAAAAAIFVAQMDGRVRFDHSRGRWYIWKDTHWVMDEVGVIINTIRMACMALVAGPRRKDKEIKEAQSWQFIRSVETLARSFIDIRMSANRWNPDAYLLGTPGGTVELMTGKLRAAMPRDMINRVTMVAPAAEEDCPKWLAFLDEALRSDAAMIRFLKQWCGYCLTGSIREEQLVFLHGPGGNGKGTFTTTFTKVMGDYHTTASMKAFLSTGFNEHTTSIAALAGARCVSAQEVEEGAKWSEDRMKMLTGGDAVTARFMRQDDFTFVPQFSLILSGNNAPTLSNVDEAIRRRMNVVPFTVQPKVINNKLKEELLEEAPGILRWAINGAVDWCQNGLVKAEAAAKATKDYLDAQDIVAEFVAEMCVVGPTLTDTLINLNRCYEAFTGEKRGEKWLAKRLRLLGYTDYFGSDGRKEFRGLAAGVTRATSDYRGR